MLQTGRPKRHTRPVQRYGAAEVEQDNTNKENTNTEDSTNSKGKTLSPKERKKRKAEARKRDKTKGEAWGTTPSNNLIMKFKRLSEN